MLFNFILSFKHCLCLLNGNGNNILRYCLRSFHSKYHNKFLQFSRTEYSFKFDNKFEIQDDVEVLKRMGLLYGLDKGECTPEDIERVKSLVPKTFEKYIESVYKNLYIL